MDFFLFLDAELTLHAFLAVKRGFFLFVIAEFLHFKWWICSFSIILSSDSRSMCLIGCGLDLGSSLSVVLGIWDTFYLYFLLIVRPMIRLVKNAVVATLYGDFWKK